MQFQREGNTHRERTEDLEKLSKKIERKSFLVYLVLLCSERKGDQTIIYNFSFFQFSKKNCAGHFLMD